MKEVLAVVRMNKIGVTKRALADAGISSMTAKECLGRGKGLVDFAVLRGAEQGYDEAMAHLGSSQRLIPKRMVSIVVPDNLVTTTVNAIVHANQTGKAGDGKVFVLPVWDSISIRTGECGDGTLDAS
jgi:nitrogen regulatory protein PII 2